MDYFLLKIADSRSAKRILLIFIALLCIIFNALS